MDEDQTLMTIEARLIEQVGSDKPGYLRLCIFFTGIRGPRSTQGI